MITDDIKREKLRRWCRALRETGLSYREIGRACGVSKMAAWYAVNGRR